MKIAKNRKHCVCKIVNGKEIILMTKEERSKATKIANHFKNKGYYYKFINSNHK